MTSNDKVNEVITTMDKLSLKPNSRPLPPHLRVGKVIQPPPPSSVNYASETTSTFNIQKGNDPTTEKKPESKVDIARRSKENYPHRKYASEVAASPAAKEADIADSLEEEASDQPNSSESELNVTAPKALSVVSDHEYESPEETTEVVDGQARSPVSDHEGSELTSVSHDQNNETPNTRVSFFSLYPHFERDLTASIKDEFERLAKQQRWSHRRTRQRRIACYEGELEDHMLFLGITDPLAQLQHLCMEVGLEAPSTRHECREVSSSTPKHLRKWRKGKPLTGNRHSRQ